MHSYIFQYAENANWYFSHMSLLSIINTSESGYYLNAESY